MDPGRRLLEISIRNIDIEIVNLKLVPELKRCCDFIRLFALVVDHKFDSDTRLVA